MEDPGTISVIVAMRECRVRARNGVESQRMATTAVRDFVASGLLMTFGLGHAAGVADGYVSSSTGAK